jgi:hydroxymethylpyrimidine/phosphomethylpyrimidine kinase
MRIRKALTIAGSDSGAGAGIQADLKTFAALGVYGTSAVTAVTAQNTLGVTKIAAMAPAMVRAQIEAVITDIGAHALKTGMLANAAIIIAVAQAIQEHRLRNLVVDPVMVATSGDLLLKKNAVAALCSRLIPLATVVTPNVPEAEELTGMKLIGSEDFAEAARRIIAMGARAVVVKGGHRSGPAVDLYYDGHNFRALRAPRIRTKNTHGTGCTFSAAITAYLARGEGIESAVTLAKKFITAAISKAFSVGSGHGPVHHFHRLWKP